MIESFTLSFFWLPDFSLRTGCDCVTFCVYILSDVWLVSFVSPFLFFYLVIDTHRLSFIVFHLPAVFRFCYNRFCYSFRNFFYLWTNKWNWQEETVVWSFMHTIMALNALIVYILYAQLAPLFYHSFQSKPKYYEKDNSTSK